MKQRTDEWLQARAGKATASRFKDVLAKIKSGEAATRRDYRYQLAVERLTRQPVQGYSNAAMQWGTDTEPQARQAFQFLEGLKVEEAGFIVHEHLLAGCSPDGLIGTDAGLEIKCPYNSTVHIQTLLDGVPPEHMAQIQGSMWITGRRRWHFVSFDPRLPEDLRYYHEIVGWDDDKIALIEHEVTRFLEEVSGLLKRLRERLE